MNYLNLTPKQFCDATDACSDGRAFALTQPTMADVLDKCPRADWLLWILDKIDLQPDDRTLRLFAIWCARNTPMSDGRKTGDMLTDPRSLAALEVVERYVNGNATDRELAAAEAAARDAARDVAEAAARDAARAAATDAAWAAARAAATDAAWDAARAAATDAAWDAARAAATDAAWDAARYAAWAAARAAATDAAWDAARAAAGAAAWSAAVAAARAAQADQLRKMIPNPFVVKEGAK